MTPEQQKALDELREELKRDPKVRIGASVMRDYEAVDHGTLDTLRRKLDGKPPYPSCRTPDICAGKGYCPRDPACNE